MKLLFSTVFFFLVTCIFLEAADKVVAHTKRSNLLKNAEQYVDFTDAELKAEIPDARYPFEFAPEVVEDKPKPKVGPVAPPPPAPLTDQEVLDRIADTPPLKPTGMLIKGGKGVLILPQGILPEGSSIKVNFGDQPYIIRVTTVTADSYTLQLNEASVTRKIDSSAGQGVRRD